MIIKIIVGYYKDKSMYTYLVSDSIEVPGEEALESLVLLPCSLESLAFEKYFRRDMVEVSLAIAILNS